MTTVAVAAGRRHYGVGNDDNEVAPLVYEQLDLEDALLRKWRMDAHLVGYLVDGYDRMQPRLNKAGFARGLGTAKMTCFFVDVDNPGHAPWTAKWYEEALAFDGENLLTEGVYHTSGGRRLVQPLAESVSVAVAELHIQRWLLTVEQRGYAVDWKCKDWTRHFRLPSVVRDHKPFLTPHMDLSRMKPLVLEPIPREEIEPLLVPRPRKPRRLGGGAAMDFSSNVPGDWRDRIAPIARAIADPATRHWHDMFLALGGALLGHGVPPEQLPPVIFAIATAAGSYDPQNDERGARDTARRWLDNTGVTGGPRLLLEWPAVSAAVERALLGATYAVTEAAPKAEPKTLEKTIADLEEAIRKAPDGLTVIAAECGLGKTKAAERVAKERAQKRHLTVVDSARAPDQSKTSISVDKNDLALQIVRHLSAEGVGVRRVYGPLSQKNADGTPVCIHHEAAEPLVAGGQSLQWEFCEGRGRNRCENYDTCTARSGSEGPEDARVTVGPHGLLGELAAEAGTTGLLVIDEPPPAIAIEKISKDDLKTALDQLERGAFELRFQIPMTRAVVAVASWRDPAAGWVDVTRSLDIAGAFDEDATHAVPPLADFAISSARRHPSLAPSLGTASRVLGLLYRALKERAAAHLEKDAITIALPDERLARAIRRVGATVITDANADIHLSAYRRIVEYSPPFHRFAAEDGTPIARTILKTSTATRSSWLPGRKLTLDTGVLNAIRKAIEWAGTDSLAIITFRTVELILRGAINPAEETIDKEWKALKQRPEVLEEARRELVDLRGEPILLGHYGATRGMDTMKDVDAIVTLGDPWYNVNSVQLLAEYCKQGEDVLMAAFARAELEQAHGRLRAVHRTRPARALHIGAMVPGGTGWAGGRPTVAQMPGGRPKGAAHMIPDELRDIVEKLGSVKDAARILQCPRTTLDRYLAGKSPVPEGPAARFRRIAELADLGQTLQQ